MGKPKELPPSLWIESPVRDSTSRLRIFPRNSRQREVCERNRLLHPNPSSELSTREVCLLDRLICPVILWIDTGWRLTLDLTSSPSAFLKFSPLPGFFNPSALAVGFSSCLLSAKNKTPSKSLLCPSFSHTLSSGLIFRSSAFAS